MPEGDHGFGKPPHPNFRCEALCAESPPHDPADAVGNVTGSDSTCEAYEVAGTGGQGVSHFVHGALQTWGLYQLTPQRYGSYDFRAPQIAVFYKPSVHAAVCFGMTCDETSDYSYGRVEKSCALVCNFLTASLFWASFDTAHGCTYSFLAWPRCGATCARPLGGLQAGYKPRYEEIQSPYE